MTQTARVYMVPETQPIEEPEATLVFSMKLTKQGFVWHATAFDAAASYPGREVFDQKVRCVQLNEKDPLAGPHEWRRCRDRLKLPFQEAFRIFLALWDAYDGQCKLAAQQHNQQPSSQQPDG